MKYEINKERIWVFAPIAMIATMITVEGNVTEGEVEEAVRAAVNQNEGLKTKVVIEGDKAYLVEQSKVNYQFEVCSDSMKELIRTQEKIPFQLEQGEYLRFFLLPEKTADMQIHSRWKLLLLSHHLAGDGTSCAYLMQDILMILDHQVVKSKPVKLFDMKELPPASDLNFVMRLLLRSMNRQWSRQEKQFSWEDFRELSGCYWKTHQTWIETRQITGDHYQNLIDYSKKNQITVNTLITTALCKAALECGELEKQDIGHAVSIRTKGYNGMGNFATGISTLYKYNESLGFAANAIKVQNLMYEKLKDKKKKYFLLQFMVKIKGNLIDAIYFSALQGYENKTAKTFSRMFGYDGNAKGISLTNLTRLPIATEYGNLKLVDYQFLPPLVLNAKRIIGVASLGNQMELSFSVEDNESKERMVHYFETVVKILRNLE